ncbi:hypothetical protein ABH923_003924 [Leifsonia sp. EB41]|uniref:hypothetical protein n=1 Tax=Leifsonia sp. EB41 TaxID=3156260 RepID=UPI00351852B9
MNSASWADYAEDPYRARLIRSSTVGNLMWGAFIVVVAVAIVLAAIAAVSVTSLNWIAGGLALIASYAAPLVFLSRSRIRRDIEIRLSAAGIQFSGHPPTYSAAAFTRWMTRNALDAESVRAALREA